MCYRMRLHSIQARCHCIRERDKLCEVLHIPHRMSEWHTYASWKQSSAHFLTRWLLWGCERTLLRLKMDVSLRTSWWHSSLSSWNFIWFKSIVLPRPFPDKITNHWIFMSRHLWPVINSSIPMNCFNLCFISWTLVHIGDYIRYCKAALFIQPTTFFTESNSMCFT